MTSQQRTILVAAVAAILGFALGAGWQYAATRGPVNELDETRQDLAFQRAEATLGAATIEAQRGSHEISRQLASDFFTALQDHVATASAERSQAFQEILAQRDAMITALSRGDPQAGSMLAQLFTRYRIAMGEPVGPQGAQTVEPVAPPDSPSAQ